MSRSRRFGRAGGASAERKVNIICPNDYSSASINEAIAAADSDVLFIADARVHIELGPNALERMAQVMTETGAGWVYADSFEHQRIDYQLGSIRDSFNFGPLIGISAPAARRAQAASGWKWGGLYDLRLGISEAKPLMRIPEPLYSESMIDTRRTGEKQFDYVDPRNRDYQAEMERIATAHLKRIGAWLAPRFESVPAAAEDFPAKASVIIPVRNRERTILDAVQSALAQRAEFEFNVIVIDNHSTDRTGEILRSISDTRLIRIVPESRTLGIGGCWNEAIYSPACGQYAVQLDSDDLYIDEAVVGRLVAKLEAGPYAMVVGSYKMVDFSLKEIPPGLIDHREWTRDNGRNNALRINGLGAPRAFNTRILRSVGFPNVSYGEDYAVALRISRDYEIARIYDPLYLCRRWEGNSDSALPLETANRYDRYKDWLRTVEIQARTGR
jgi:hypothetical protein